MIDGMPSGTVISRWTGWPCWSRSRIAAPLIARGNLELAGLDRVARAEQPRAQHGSCSAMPGSAPAFSSWSRDRGERSSLPATTIVSLAAAAGARPTPEQISSQRERDARSASPQAAGCRTPAQTAFMTRLALVPPKPKLLLSTARTSRFLALCGTRSTPSVPSSGLSRLSVGGTIWSRIARMQKIALDRAGAAEQVADRRLGRAHRHAVQIASPNTPLDRAQLDRRRPWSRCRGR